MNRPTIPNNDWKKLLAASIELLNGNDSARLTLRACAEHITNQLCSREADCACTFCEGGVSYLD